MTTRTDLETEYNRLLAEGLEEQATRLEPMINYLARLDDRPDTMTLALGLAARGFAVFPAVGKQPDGHWPSISSTNAERIVAMWAGKGDRNIGISCKRSGLVVVDEDRVGGFEAAAASVGASVPSTYSVATGKGRHYYFRAPEGCVLGNSPGGFAEFGCDVRGPGEPDSYGGYVIAAGSTHPSGAVYGEIDSAAEVEPLPLWVAEMIEGVARANSDPIASPGPSTPVGFVLPDTIAGPRSSSGGSRHSTIVGLSASLRARSVPIDLARDLVSSAWRRCEQPPVCLTPFGEGEALKILGDIYARYREGPSTGSRRNALRSPESDETAGRRLWVETAATIEPRRVHWAWEGRLARGTLGLLAGPEGLGKSTLGYWIAARLTRGELPGEFEHSRRAVLVCATEDAWAEVIVPRLIAAGADLALVYRVDAITHDDLIEGLELPTDNQAVADLAAETHAALLLLDPLISRLAAGLDSHKDGEVRQALEPLVHMLGATGLAALGLIHLNKGNGSIVLDRIMASKAFTAVARSVHVVLPDPDDETGARRLFGTAKNNLGSIELPTLGFVIDAYPVPTSDGPAITGRIVFGDDGGSTIADALGQTAEDPSIRSETREAVEWLTDYMEAEPCALSGDIKREAGRAGLSLSTLQRARQRLGLRMWSEGFPRRSYWATADYAATHARARGGTQTTGTTGTTGTTAREP